MLRLFKAILLAVFVAILIVASYWLGQQAVTWMPVQATAEAQQVDRLFGFLVAIGAFVFLGITGVIGYSLLTCRAPEDDYSQGHPARGSTAIEIIWTVAPTLLVIWIAAQSFSIYQQLSISGLSPIVLHHLPLEQPAYAEGATPKTPSQSQPIAETIEVTAKQWAWLFRYPDSNVTSTELHLLVNQGAQLLMRSEDVLHGFYVPEFRVKQDIIPERVITFVVTPLREGKYLLKDSQFSGTYFSVMEADVYVESPEAHQKWLTEAAARKPTAAANPAFREYSRSKATQPVKRSAWATIAPAQPSIVNYSSPGNYSSSNSRRIP
jgi:cytochrome c oxidase subunit II